MLTIDPPPGWLCITSLACWETDSAPSRLQLDDFPVELRAGLRRQDEGRTSSIVTTAWRPCRSTIASIIALASSATEFARVEFVRQAFDLTPRAAATVAPCSAKIVLMPAPTPRTPPVTSTTRPVSPECGAAIGMSHCASVPSKCLLVNGPSPPKEVVEDLDDDHVAHRQTGDSRSHRRLPVNAIPSRGWFELGEVLTAAGNDQTTRAVILRPRASTPGWTSKCSGPRASPR